MILINAICWFLPSFFIKGNVKYYILLIVFLFSSSYWLPVYFLPENYSTYTIKADFLDQFLDYSLYAAIFFYIGVFYMIGFRRNYTFDFKSFEHIINNINIKKSHIVLFNIFFILSLIYSYSEAISQIGVYRRVEFMDEIKPFWFTTLIYIMSPILCVILFYNLKNINKVNKLAFFISQIYLLLFVFLVGFDGSRRLSLLPIIVNSGFTILNFIKPIKLKGTLKLLLLYNVFLFFFTAFLSLNRNFLVGWQIFNIPISMMLEFQEDLIGMLITPSSTLHVNTQMAEYIANEGVQGYKNYFFAIGNTLLPKFIFQTYIFGEPLVVYLHKKFNWYGQDFGFMAEAIYSGGTMGVIIMHFLIGLFIGFSIKKSYFGSIFYSILMLTIIYGFLNSLRSDFMNLSKTILYPAIILFLFYKVLFRYIKKLI